MEKTINESKLSRDEIHAMYDAVNDLIHQVHPEVPPIIIKVPPTGGGGKELTKEYTDAWNAILATYDKDSVTMSELLQLRQDIDSGKLTSL